MKMTLFTIRGMFGLCFWAALISASHQDRVDDERGAKPTMLRESRHHNKKLERHIGRLNMVLDGLQQLCQTINGVQPTEKNHTKHEVEVDTSDHDDIILKEISSSGKKGNAVDVTISFLAPKKATTLWKIYYDAGQSQMFDGTGGSDGDLRQSAITVTDISNVSYLVFSVTSEEIYKSIEIDIDHVKIMEPVHEELFFNISSSVDVKISESYQTKAGEDLVIYLPLTDDSKPIRHTGHSDGLLIDILRHTYAGLVSMNTSTEPHSIGTINTSGYPDNSIGIIIAGPDPDRDNTDDNDDALSATLQLTLRQAYAHYGGILTLFLKSNMASNLITDLRTIRYALILMPDSDTHFPQYSLAVQTQETTYVSPDQGSVHCSAVGNPAPKITVMKVRNNGRPPRKESVVTDSKFNSVMVVKNFVKQKLSDVKGTYICSATNGNETIESYMTVDVFQNTTFDDKITRLKKNASEEIVVVCKATGNPRPELSLYQWEYDDITDGVGNKVVRKQSGKYTSKLTVTIPTEYLESRYLTCNALQEMNDYVNAVNKPVLINENLPEYHPWHVASSTNA